MTSEYDDEIWELAGDSEREPDPWLAACAEAFAAGCDAVLDLGCGDGLYLPALAKSAASVIGADRSAVALERAARRWPQARLCEVGANERLPLEDNSVERVWCCDTLEHVVDTQIVLSEAFRVLAPGGRLIVITPDHPLRLRLRLALGGWDEHFDPFSPHLRFYTRSALVETLDYCGFNVESVTRRDGSLVAEAGRA